MKPEAQRIAIAEACGWTSLRVLGGKIAGKKPDGTDPVYLPDYLNDLNAMHEAEKVLVHPDEFRNYERNLDKCVPIEERWLCATAAQRAEAFIKTLDLWEDTE